jgi:hypothetical protein
MFWKFTILLEIGSGSVKADLFFPIRRVLPQAIPFFHTHTMSAPGTQQTKAVALKVRYEL